MVSFFHENGDKMMLLFAFAGLLTALWIFRNDTSVAITLGTQLGVVIGAICGIAQGKPRQVTQQNIDSNVSQAVEPK